jgi:hypothetical protein
MARKYDNFKKVSSLQPVFDGFIRARRAEDHKAFAVEEFIRFYSVAGTILANFRNIRTNVNERILSHILMRSLLENYFWLLYIFFEDYEASWSNRFEEYMDGFKSQYYKLYEEPYLPHKQSLQKPDSNWKTLKRTKDLNSVLVALKNDYGDKLSYLYFVYRITSFDTHGKTMRSLFSNAFRKDCNFPYLKIEETIDLIANGYLVIWDKIK